MSLTPLFDRVIILPDEQETITDGGIIIPDTAKEGKVETGLVLAIGPGYYTDNGFFVKTQIKPGSKVLFGKYAGSETEIDDKRILIMRERDIIAVLESKED